MTCIRISEKYWLFNPIDLFSNYKLYPNQRMGIAAKCNTILRLCILAFLFLLLFNYKYAGHFMLACMVFNVVFYYLYKDYY